MAFRRKDPNRRNVITIAKASGVTFVEGDLVKKNGTSNNVTNASMSGAAVLGIVLEAAASASTSAVRVDVLSPGEWLIGDVSSGTPASGDAKSGDYASAAGAAVGTDSNHDYFYIYNGTTTTVDLLPHKLEVTTAA